MSTDLIKILVQIVLILTIIVGLLWKAIKDRKNDKPASSHHSYSDVRCKPGHGEMCQEHDRDITDLKRCYDFVREDIAEIKTKMDKNFSDLFALLRK